MAWAFAKFKLAVVEPSDTCEITNRHKAALEKILGANPGALGFTLFPLVRRHSFALICHGFYRILPSCSHFPGALMHAGSFARKMAQGRQGGGILMRCVLPAFLLCVVSIGGAEIGRAHV